MSCDDNVTCALVGLACWSREEKRKENETKRKD